MRSYFGGITARGSRPSTQSKQPAKHALYTIGGSPIHVKGKKNENCPKNYGLSSFELLGDEQELGNLPQTPLQAFFTESPDQEQMRPKEYAAESSKLTSTAEKIQAANNMPPESIDARDRGLWARVC